MGGKGQNDGGGVFTRILSGDIVTDGGSSQGSSWADYNNDGFVDLFVANKNSDDNFLYENPGNSNNWMHIEFDPVPIIGTKVSVKADIEGISTWQHTQVSSQTGFGSQSLMEPIFGLADATILDSIKVVWVDGSKEYLENQNINQIITISFELCLEDEVELWGTCYDIATTTTLDLPFSNITGEIPAELGNLPNLTYLWLYDNQLTGDIPIEIGNLNNLKYLNLSGNSINGPIPFEIGNLTNLIYLSFS